MSNTITATAATIRISGITATNVEGLLELQGKYFAADTRVENAERLRAGREAHLLATVALSVAAWRGAGVGVKDAGSLVRQVASVRFRQSDEQASDEQASDEQASDEQASDEQGTLSPLAKRLPSGDRAIAALAAVGVMIQRNGGNDAALGSAKTIATALDTLAWLQQARRGEARWTPANVMAYARGFETLAPMVKDLAKVRERITDSEAVAKIAAKAESDAAPTVALLAGNAASIVAGIRKRLDAGEVLTDADCAGIESLKLAVAAL